MNWIKCEDQKPESPFDIVFITDGKLTALASWINDPKKYYGDELEELEQEEGDFYQSHWKFITTVGPFIKNDECFGTIYDVSHWMPLPSPPIETD